MTQSLHSFALLIWALLFALATTAQAETGTRALPGAPAAKPPTLMPSQPSNVTIQHWQVNTGTLQFNGLPAPKNIGRPAGDTTGPEPLKTQTGNAQSVLAWRVNTQTLQFTGNTHARGQAPTTPTTTTTAPRAQKPQRGME